MSAALLTINVVQHIAKGKICIISNLAHIKLFVRLDHIVETEWQRQCPSRVDSIRLWPAPTFKLQADQMAIFMDWTQTVTTLPPQRPIEVDGVQLSCLS